jgi:proteasome activator subunit 4
MKAADDVLAQLTLHTPSADLIKRISAGEDARLAHQNQQYDILLDNVIAKTHESSLNWRYHQAATRFLYSMTRRDRPTDSRLLGYFLSNVSNAHPRIRDYGSAGLTRMLFQPERLFLQEPFDPFTSTLDLTKEEFPAFTEKYLKAFGEEPGPDSVLQDRLDTGWLCWGRTMEVSRFSGWDEQSFNLEPESKPAVDQLIAAVNDADWWKKLADFWSQEETRNYPSANHIDLILALCQVVGRPVLDQVQPLVMRLLANMDDKKVYDRHITRCVWELIGGLLRGSWEWAGKDRKDFWDWFTPLLPDLFRNIRQDTTKCWDITIEYVLHEQDPRRFKPLVDFMLNTALAADFQSGSAFDLNRRVQLVRSVLRCFRWRFTSHAPAFEEWCFKGFDCPYAEVRGAMGSVLNGIDQLHWNASYPSATALINDILSDPERRKDVMRIRQTPFKTQLLDIVERLKVLRQERPHGPTAMMSAHDTTAVTMMHWLSVELSDVHAVATFPSIIPIL